MGFGVWQPTVEAQEAAGSMAEAVHDHSDKAIRPGSGSLVAHCSKDSMVRSPAVSTLVLPP